MATTIDQGFRQLRSNLQITSLQASTVAERQRNVRTVVAAELTVLDHFLTGSYMRDTMIAPLSEADVDIFVVLHPQYFEQYGGQANLLDRVKRALQRNYRASDISRSGRAVTICFSDFQVDVVPAFNRNFSGYLIPDSPGQRWIETDPKRHVSLWEELNRNQQGAFVPFVKMLKAWNKSHSQLLGSFHLETMAWEIFRYRQIEDYTLATVAFFQQAQGLIHSPRPDPAGYAGGVGLLSQSDRLGIASRMQSAAERAEAAVHLGRQGRIAEAFSRWRVLFGERYFPSYG
jgi:hypothetical protein